MPIDDNISVWLEQLKQGDRESVKPLLDQYFQRLVGLAAARMRGQAHLGGYEEDVALSAFKSLCLGAEKGRFPDLQDRDELWRLLAVITIRKAIDLRRRKRLDLASDQEMLQAFLGREPSPEEVHEMSDQVLALLDKLGDPELRKIALWKVEGYTNEEIAQRLSCVVRTVERKLHQIRLAWQSESA
ncbi:ECF-type sigma factor [Bythopirellula goksoeyrii]|uniref:RNA polymerase sigma factor n=1 Tax=Bythopirellula goksoeyrii TaxID=1400387 RepID=A0A5B9QJ31_9BACT|nr:ECF-type sigma factor [Bythopirellula goksoeyrii]QEG38019.1 RNA polymerase sigma factor [Bythopirellula goksoeyrii]